jgi:hypothetical protein
MSVPIRGYGNYLISSGFPIETTQIVYECSNKSYLDEFQKLPIYELMKEYIKTCNYIKFIIKDNDYDISIISDMWNNFLTPERRKIISPYKLWYNFIDNKIESLEKIKNNNSDYIWSGKRKILRPKYISPFQNPELMLYSMYPNGITYTFNQKQHDNDVKKYYSNTYNNYIITMKRNEDLNKSKLEISEDKSKDKVIKKLDGEITKIQDLENQNITEKLEFEINKNQDLQTKLEEQLKLNETLCKRLFELK